MSTDKAQQDEVPEDAEVSLHILVLLFIRCRFICAQMIHRHGLHTHLANFLSFRLWQQSTKNETLVTLAVLVLDLYERAVGAISLRKKAVELYKGQHTWMHLDEHNGVWIEQASFRVKIDVDQVISRCLTVFFLFFSKQEAPLSRTIDEAFHNGATRVYFNSDAHIHPRHHTFRQGLHVEFSRMSQHFSDSPVSRPILLLPDLPHYGPPSSTDQEVKDVAMTSSSHNDNSAVSSGTDYELMIQRVYLPEGLSPDHRKDLCLALLQRFRQGVVDTECANSLLRLLLRLICTSFTDIETFLEADILEVLCEFAHPQSFSGLYISFVIYIIRQASIA